jgi:hypothetical protein
MTERSDVCWDVMFSLVTMGIECFSLTVKAEQQLSSSPLRFWRCMHVDNRREHP